MPLGTLIQLRRDTVANWTMVNPVLAEGEAGFELDTSKLKIGNGVTAWSSLPYISGTAAASVYAGTDTLASGTVTVSASWVTPTFVIVVTAQAAPSTPGTILYVDPANIMDGVSFDITSDDGTDARDVFWMAAAPNPEPVIETGFVMKSDASAGDAFLDKDLGSDKPTVWVTVDVAFEAAAITFWDGSSSGSGYLVDLQNADPTEILAIFIQNTLAWQDDGINGGNNASPAPAASTWQHLEFHYDTASRLTEFFINTSAVSGIGGSGSADSSFDIRHVLIGQFFSNGDAAEVVYYKNVKIGTTREGDDLFSEDFSGDLSAWDVTGDCTIIADPF